MISGVIILEIIRARGLLHLPGFPHLNVDRTTVWNTTSDHVLDWVSVGAGKEAGRRGNLWVFVSKKPHFKVQDGTEKVNGRKKDHHWLAQDTKLYELRSPKVDWTTQGR